MLRVVILLKMESLLQALLLQALLNELFRNTSIYIKAVILVSIKSKFTTPSEAMHPQIITSLPSMLESWDYMALILEQICFCARFFEYLVERKFRIYSHQK